jgi:hypothetical protein
MNTDNALPPAIGHRLERAVDRKKSRGAVCLVLPAVRPGSVHEVVGNAAGPVWEGAGVMGASAARTLCCDSTSVPDRQLPAVWYPACAPSPASFRAPTPRVIEHRQGFFLECQAVLRHLQFLHQPAVLLFKLLDTPLLRGLGRGGTGR